MTQTTSNRSVPAGYVLGDDEGEAYHGLGSLTINKVGAGVTAGAPSGAAGRPGRPAPARCCSCRAGSRTVSSCPGTVPDAP